jgi:hypothetical protein
MNPNPSMSAGDVNVEERGGSDRPAPRWPHGLAKERQSAVSFATGKDSRPDPYKLDVRSSSYDPANRLIFRAPSRTLTDAYATAFQAVSADNHPIHYNVEYARSHGHTAPVVPGLQVLAFTAPGATLFPQYIGDVPLRPLRVRHRRQPRGGAAKGSSSRLPA